MRMCGRAVQRSSSVSFAASLFGATSTVNNDKSLLSSTQQNIKNSFQHQSNLSPGQMFAVFQKIENNGSGCQIQSCEKVWGLVTQRGTSKMPLRTGPSKHFSSLMFNARSETACEKVSFRNLVRTGKSCVLAVEGFFEWKNINGVKQPYFVHRSDGKPLLVAGLYTAVPTGHKDDPILHTFTVLTTAACPKLTWLHHRMPVLLWDGVDSEDGALARSWLDSPLPEKLLQISSHSSSLKPRELTWYPVTRKMSNPRYAGNDCTVPVQLTQTKSITSFLVSAKSKTKNSDKFQGSSTTSTQMERYPTHLTKRNNPYTTNISPNKLQKVSPNVTSTNKESITADEKCPTTEAGISSYFVKKEK